MASAFAAPAHDAFAALPAPAGFAALPTPMAAGASTGEVASAGAEQRHALKIQGRDRQPCLMPGCPFMEHSDPAPLWKPGYCCNKCAGRHSGKEWAEGGIKHYAHCEKLPHGLDAEPPQQLGGGGKKKKKKKHKHQALPVDAPMPEDGESSWK